MIDYHIHTPLCNHATGSMEAFIRFAIEKGLCEICFTDHFTPYEINTKPKWNTMGANEIPLYVNAVMALKHKYRDAVTIKLGLEIDFDADHLSIIETIISQYDFDLIIGSVHFVNDVNIASFKQSNTINPVENDTYISGYTQKLSEMLDHDFFDVVGHLDIFKKTGKLFKTKDTDKTMTEIVHKIAEKDKAVELNTSGFDHTEAEPYPSEAILSLCADNHIPVILSSDAHKPSQLGRHFNSALSLLKKNSIETIAIYSKRIRKEHPVSDLCYFS